MDRQPGLCLTRGQARPLCASTGVKSVRGAKAMGQESGTCFSRIRNELKEQHLSGMWLVRAGCWVLWNGGMLVFPCRLWEGTKESLEEGQVS